MAIQGWLSRHHFLDVFPNKGPLTAVEHHHAHLGILLELTKDRFQVAL